MDEQHIDVFALLGLVMDLEVNVAESNPPPDIKWIDLPNDEEFTSISSTGWDIEGGPETHIDPFHRSVGLPNSANQEKSRVCAIAALMSYI
ncbi:hypothetical protein FRB95_014377 [Tulasnella sp. JGI-2019a]|nr:hypothetical protein FRB95_014377 [Tulasnella sp. JGI-2019a]